MTIKPLLGTIFIHLDYLRMIVCFAFHAVELICVTASLHYHTLIIRCGCSLTENDSAQFFYIDFLSVNCFRTTNMCKNIMYATYLSRKSMYFLRKQIETILIVLLQ